MNELVIKDSEITLSDLGQVLVKSGFFADTRDAAQAVVKVLAGRELGFGPIASMTGINIIKGRVTLSANLIASAVKRSTKYNYRIITLDDNLCEIAFFEAGKEIGLSQFTIQDATKAGIVAGDNWKKYPRNMLFSRAMSNGVKWYCPDISNSPLYTPDELGATIDGETGDVIDFPLSEPEVIDPADKFDTAQIEFEDSIAKRNPEPAPEKMSLETAMAVQNSEGVAYGEIPTEKLVYMHGSLAKKLKLTDLPAEERETCKFKQDAINVILHSRK